MQIIVSRLVGRVKIQTFTMRNIVVWCCVLPSIAVVAFHPAAASFQPHPPPPPPHPYDCHVRCNRWTIGGTTPPHGSERDPPPPAPKYKFGDLTKGLLKKGKEKLNEILPEGEEYKFGDISRHLDAKAKARILQARTTTKATTTPDHTNNHNNNNNVEGATTSHPYRYQVGDLSRWVDHVIKEQAAQFVGKATAEDYQWGDVTQTILRRVQSGEYRVDDVWLALRILTTAGVAILPITNALPLHMLLQLAEADLAKDVTLRITESVATSLDARFKQALTGKSDYQLGDWTKNRLKRQVQQLTQKDHYEFGDIVKAMVFQKKQTTAPTTQNVSALILPDAAADEELRDWDNRFLSTNYNATTRWSKE
jgi:hypothetical protein